MFEQLCLTMPRFSNKLETFEGFFCIIDFFRTGRSSKLNQEFWFRARKKFVSDRSVHKRTWGSRTNFWPRQGPKGDGYERSLMAKRFLVPHKHASTAGMGALTRTAIGIRRKWKETKDRESKEGKENKGNYSKYINMLASLRAYAKQSRSNTARSHLWPLDRRSRFAPSRWQAIYIFINLLNKSCVQVLWRREYISWLLLGLRFC